MVGTHSETLSFWQNIHVLRSTNHYVLESNATDFKILHYTIIIYYSVYFPEMINDLFHGTFFKAVYFLTMIAINLFYLYKKLKTEHLRVH